MLFIVVTLLCKILIRKSELRSVEIKTEFNLI